MTPIIVDRRHHRDRRDGRRCSPPSSSSCGSSARGWPSRCSSRCSSSITFMPACLAIFGRALFWPRRPRVELSQAPSCRGVRRRADRATAALARRALRLRAAVARGRALRRAARRAAPAGCSTCGWPTRSSAGCRPAASRARPTCRRPRGFAPGMLSPTVLVVSRTGIATQRDGARPARADSNASRGVALVLGPRLQPRAGRALRRDDRPRRRRGPLLHRAAATIPLGARGDRRAAADPPADARLPRRDRARRRRSRRSPGDTALSAETIDKTVSDLARIAPLALLVDPAGARRSTCGRSSRRSTWSPPACSGSPPRWASAPSSSGSSPTTCRSPSRCCWCRWARTTTSSSSAACGRRPACGRCTRPSRSPRHGPRRRSPWPGIVLGGIVRAHGAGPRPCVPRDRRGHDARACSSTRCSCGRSSSPR